MRSPAHDLALYLASQGVGAFAAPTTSSGWGINVNVEPDKPDNVVTLYDTGGDAPDTDELDLLRPTFQVRTRSVSDILSHSKQEEIRDLLMLPGAITTGDGRYVGIDMTSDQTSIGRDDVNRFLRTANYRAIRERS